MACTDKKPKKGILKNSSSFDKTEPHLARKEMKWDEMNIIATHHPPDKDYGHMKIDEPPTPYSKYAIGEEEEDGVRRRGSFDPHSEDEHDGLDPLSIASKLEGDHAPKVLRPSFTDEEEEEEESDEDREETEEERAVRKAFEKKRKLHYNEFQAMKLAKQLIADEEDDGDGDLVDEEAAKNARVNSRPSIELCMDGETSMEGVSSFAQTNDEGSSVDGVSNTLGSDQ